MEMKIGHGMANHGPEPHAALRLVSCGSLSVLNVSLPCFFSCSYFLTDGGRGTGERGASAHKPAKYNWKRELFAYLCEI